jgi:hypothetical protein
MAHHGESGLQDHRAWFDKLTMRESEDCRESRSARLFKLKHLRLACSPPISLMVSLSNHGYWSCSNITTLSPLPRPHLRLAVERENDGRSLERGSWVVRYAMLAIQGPPAPAICVFTCSTPSSGCWAECTDSFSETSPVSQVLPAGKDTIRISEVGKCWISWCVFSWWNGLGASLSVILGFNPRTHTSGNVYSISLYSWISSPFHHGSSGHPRVKPEERG